MPTSRVMLCDDEAGYRNLVKAVFEPLGEDFEYLESGDGGECLRAVATEPVDYILIDLNMPRFDGYSAIPKLRAELPACKIIALSTARPEEAEARCLALGATAFVEKPRDIFELPNIVCEKLRAAA